MSVMMARRTIFGKNSPKEMQLENLPCANYQKKSWPLEIPPKTNPPQVGLHLVNLRAGIAKKQPSSASRHTDRPVGHGGNKKLKR